jgi:membrane protein YqaA with SNARE-associated domain
MAFLWAILKPLGIWGIFVVSAIDGAFIGLPMDVVVAGYVYQNRARLLLYVLMASAGSALGSIVIYLIGYEGGEELLRKRISPERFEKFHRAFEQHPFWSLMFPAMLPPPTPFKLFVLAAAVSEMNFGHFLMAIFAGRCLRFLVLSFVTVQFGPEFAAVSVRLFREHFDWVLAAAAIALVAWMLLKRFVLQQHTQGRG